jgi:uncharacterized membrane protein YidH (DUF202 family)
LTKRKRLKNFEPNLRQIDDYNGTATKEKKRVIRNVILGLILVGGIYSAFYNYFNSVEDQIPQTQNLLERNF